jgi:hypothetical protein
MRLAGHAGCKERELEVRTEVCLKNVNKVTFMTHVDGSVLKEQSVRDSIHVAVAKDQLCGEVNTVPSLRFSEANITFSKAA